MRLLERGPQRLDLAQLELPVATGVRRGSGKPNRRSQERSVFGLTPSIAAAAFVRIAGMVERIAPRPAAHKWCIGACTLAGAVRPEGLGPAAPTPGAI